MKLQHKIQMGSVSHGTMRKEDLIPCFVDEILWYNPKNKEALKIRKILNRRDQKFEAGIEQDNYFESEESDYDLELLFDELNNLCDLPYFYFGAHCGDGSDYGFWLSENLEYEFEGLQVEDTGNVPDDYQGEFLQINDHGNITLYNRVNGKNTEIWSIV
jgi:hypothetical protein